MKKIFALFCAAVISAALVACSHDSDRGDGSGRMYNASLLGNPESLDPQFARDASSETVISNLYSGLMKTDADGNIVNCNVSNYYISDDGLYYTFILRKDNYWFIDRNGNDREDEGESFPVTAPDYVFAFQRILDPEMHSPYAADFSCIKNGADITAGNAPAESLGVTAPDDFTLEIELEYPSAEFMKLLTTNAACPCNEEFFYSTKGRYGLDDDSVMSNGAFFVRQWFFDPYGKDNILYMKRNSLNSRDDDKVYPSFLSFTIEETQDAIAAKFGDKATDCLTAADISPYSEKKYDIHPETSVTLGIIANPADGICSDTDMMKALALSIDREAVETRQGGDIGPAYGIIPPAVKLLGRSYRELYDDTGLGAGDSGEAAALVDAVKRDHNTETLDSLKILVSAESVDTSYLHAVTERWQETIGVYIGIEEVSREDFERRLEEGDYRFALYPVTGTYNSGVSVLENAVKDEHIGLSDSYDGVLDDLKKSADFSLMVDKFAAAEKKILSEYRFIPVFYKNMYLVTKKECEDIEYDAFSGAISFRSAKYFD